MLQHQKMLKVKRRAAYKNIYIEMQVKGNATVVLECVFNVKDSG